jgi:hypothetical protein
MCGPDHILVGGKLGKMLGLGLVLELGLVLVLGLGLESYIENLLALCVDLIIFS